MQILGFVFWGAVTWLLAVSAFVGIICGMNYLVGPPMSDRANSFAFIGGGGMMFILGVIAAGVAATIVHSAMASP